MNPATLLTLAATIAAVASSPAHLPTAQDQARFLAGMAVANPGLLPASKTPAWDEHSRQLDKVWSNLEEHHLGSIRSWRTRTLDPAAAAHAPLYYMFSGPDFLYASTLFPQSSPFILCGLEPVGTVPHLAKLPPDTLASCLADLRQSLNSIISFGFFITEDMKRDLNSSPVRGVLPVLYVFLARLGNRITAVEPVCLDNEGFPAAADTPTPGVKISFTNAHGSKQALYYFTTNLSDSEIHARPGFMNFCRRLPAGNSLVKSASYLLHREHFSTVRSFLLEHSRLILQDDSGIPVHSFPPQSWALRCFGNYAGPIKLFDRFHQPDLAAMFHRGADNPALSFSFGYRWRPNESSLIIARPLHSPPAPRH